MGRFPLVPLSNRAFLAGCWLHVALMPFWPALLVVSISFLAYNMAVAQRAISTLLAVDFQEMEWKPLSWPSLCARLAGLLPIPAILLFSLHLKIQESGADLPTLPEDPAFGLMMIAHFIPLGNLAFYLQAKILGAKWFGHGLSNARLGNRWGGLPAMRVPSRDEIVYIRRHFLE